jgi:hypothetical protein
MLLIVHFEGVLGDVFKPNLADESVQLVLRHGCIDGLKEILKNFQVALFSFLADKTIRYIVEYFLKEDIVFDGVYSRVQTHGKTDEFANYN